MTSSPECIPSDSIPRLFVEYPIRSLIEARPTEAITEVIATLRLSLYALIPCKLFKIPFLLSSPL